MPDNPNFLSVEQREEIRRQLLTGVWPMPDNIHALLDSHAEADRREAELREEARKLHAYIAKLNNKLASKDAEFESYRINAAHAAKVDKEAVLLESYLRRQWKWSSETFGAGVRTKGIIQHIEKELLEIKQNPFDLSEWIDVAVLALDGYWRHGGTPERIMVDLQAKQDRNFAREWPVPTSEDEAVEHVRTPPAKPAEPLK